MEYIEIDDFSIEDLGVLKMPVYDIEVETNHNFFANNILVHNSMFLNLDPIKKLLNNQDDIVTWVNKFDEDLLSKLFKNLLDSYFAKFNTQNEMNFKLEKIINQMIVFGKKNYAMEILSNEGAIYKKQDFKVMGFASKRSDRPFFCKKKINDIVQLYFKDKNKELLSTELRKIQKEFISQKIEDIARPVGVTKYRKYAKPLEEYEKDGLSFQLHTPRHNRASIIYNYIVKKENLPYELVDDGAKIKYVMVYPDNKYCVDVIGFIGHYPKEFENIFKIDYDRQLQDTFFNSIQIMYDAVGWGVINLEYQEEEYVS